MGCPTYQDQLVTTSQRFSSQCSMSDSTIFSQNIQDITLLKPITMPPALSFSDSPTFHPSDYIRIIVSAALFHLAATTTGGQIDPVEPFGDNLILGPSDEVVIISAPALSDLIDSRIFDVDGTIENGFTSGSLLQTNNVPLEDDNGNPSATQLDVATGNFLTEDSVDVVAVWEGTARSIILQFSQIDSANLEWDSPEQLTIQDDGLPALFDTTEFGFRRIIRLLPAQLDSDRFEELVLAYWAADMSIQIAVYDPDPSGNGPLKLQTSINDEVPRSVRRGARIGGEWPLRHYGRRF